MLRLYDIQLPAGAIVTAKALRYTTRTGWQEEGRMEDRTAQARSCSWSPRTAEILCVPTRC